MEASVDLRRVGPADTAVLTPLQQQLRPQQTPLPLAEETRGWLAAAAAGPVGYAAVTPVPGLPDLGELTGGILAPHRRRGYGRFLLAHLLNDLAGGDLRRLSYPVSAPYTAAARFLRRAGFLPHHGERRLRRPLAALPPRPAANGRRLRALADPDQAAALFCRLYRRSFGATPWYQPYSEAEVLRTLHDPADLLFLYVADTPLGFAWMRREDEVGEIEPFGIIEEEQGAGHGRYLLTTALHHLATRGAARVQIGAWERNQAALRLYHRLGFRPYRRQIYLEREIGPLNL